MTAELKPIKIAAEIFYARDTYTINKKFNEDNDKYQLTAGKLSEAAQEKLSELDIKIKDKEVPGKHITSKSKYPFKFYTEEGDEIPAERIGNGTKVHLLVTAYRHKMSKQHGAAASVKRIIVTDLVEYAPEGSIVDEEEAL